MLDTALKVLKEITSHGYKAYLVGGYVRDYLLGIDSNDIDINTNATPKELKEIFEDGYLPRDDYGSVTIMKSGIRFEITTFRKEITYINNRKPVEIKYIDDLYEDLLRRDFTINTICMNKDGEIIDYLDGQSDLRKRVIRTIGDAKDKFSEDSLRILRAVRFATSLGFELDSQVKSAIVETKKKLANISYNRKKEELDKIFASSNCNEGISLLIELGLDKELELYNLAEISYTDSLIGIWAMLDVDDLYPFTNNEKELINSIRECLKLNNLDPMALYKYGLYVNSVVGDIKGIDKKDITYNYNNLVIQKRSDLEITSDDIMKCLNKGPGAYLKDIYSDLEREVLYRRVKNNKDILTNYIYSKYGS